MDEAGEEVIPRCPREHVNLKHFEKKDALRKVSSKEEKQFRQKIKRKILFGRSSLEISFHIQVRYKINCDQMVYLI